MYNHELSDAIAACSTSTEALRSALNKITKEIEKSTVCEYTSEELRALALLIVSKKVEAIVALLKLLSPKTKIQTFTTNSQLVEAAEPYLEDSIQFIILTVMQIASTEG